MISSSASLACFGACGAGMAMMTPIRTRVGSEECAEGRSASSVWPSVEEPDDRARENGHHHLRLAGGGGGTAAGTLMGAGGVGYDGLMYVAENGWRRVSVAS